jgi:outer membrane protein assembly factor BamD
MKKLILAPFFALLVLSCSSKNKGEPNLLPLLGESGTADLTDEGSEKNYDALTLLRRGEQFYDKEDYPEAIGEYQRFLDLHPMNRLAPYVQFRLGMAYYHQIGTIDRDQEPAQRALSAFERLQNEFPNSLYGDQAREKIAGIKERLSQRQFDVGYFYYKRGAYPAAIARFGKVIEENERPSLKGEALYYSGLSHLRLGKEQEAIRLLREFLEVSPESPRRSEVTRLLGRIEGSSRLSRLF